MKLEDIFKGNDSRAAKLREEATKKKASKTKKAKRKYTKLEADKSAAVGEQVENDGGVEGDGLPGPGAIPGVELSEVSETAEAAKEVATGLGESCRNSRRRQVTVHED
ncbi:hypothetical protein Q9L58_003511 [Maublancomyces gigas]|uniref:Uncharacterized protein n=1 Tax=Discina gigas TaxID=1032678 RepID=A0ABR3GNF0_9PEZI